MANILAMDYIRRVIFSYSGGYNFIHRQVCTEFRENIPEVCPLVYFDALCSDGRQPKHVQPDDTWATIALDQGLLHILQWSIHCYTGKEPCEETTKGGHLHILKWLKEQGYECTIRVATLAVKGSHLEILKWCKDNNWFSKKKSSSWSKSLTLEAAIKGNREILQWAIDNGCEWHDNSLIHLLRSKNPETVKWAIENGCPWGTFPARGIAETRDLSLFEWCMNRGCPWDTFAPAEMAKNGDLHMLEWAVDNFLSLVGEALFWDEKTCSGAALNGNLKLLKWLRERGCPWSKLLVIMLL